MTQRRLHSWSMGNSNRSPFRRVGEPRKEADPTPAEIASLCEEIQADWSEQERQARRLWMPRNGTLVRPNMENLPAVYEIPEVRCA